RKRFLRYLLPVTLFLFVACGSLCARINVACIRQEWWRDAGLVLLTGGVCLLSWQQHTCPQELDKEMLPAVAAVEAEPAENAGCPAGQDHSGSGSDAGTALPRESGGNEAKAEGSPEAEIQARGPWKLIRYPDRSSTLVELVGLSMALSAWMP